MKVLTKSKFKTGLSCPNKLHYAYDDKYANKSSDDSFLASIAEGGFQVEALARMHYPNGVFLNTKKGDNKSAWEQTKGILNKDKAVIYEASFLVNNLFVMSDIIVKDGNTLKLIEVKAKSFDSSETNTFLGKNKKIYSKWKPYLFDIAFQKYVIQICLPHLKIESYFILADKSKKSKINGLNQLIRLPQKSSDRKDIKVLISPEEAVKTSVLTEINVSDIVNKILSDEEEYSESLTFSKALKIFEKTLKTEVFPGWPTDYSSCKNCQFQTSVEEEKSGQLSGFKNCFKTMHNLSENELNSPNIFELWNFRGDKFLKKGEILLKNLDKNDFKSKTTSETLTANDRRWLQIKKAVTGDKEVFINRKGLRKEMSKWRYPLHFIDFETSAVALPFNKGIKPYEQIAFQFSHHIVNSDNKIIHKSQFISDQPGVFPNFNFIKQLKKSLENDNGTVFRFASHENSILNAIKTQLETSDYENKNELINFIKSIAEPTGNSYEDWIPSRSFIDLREVILDYYYHPLTKGSNSIKAILPAIVNTCDFLKSKYSLEIGKINLTSLNFESNKKWLVTKDKHTINPYKQLPNLFNDWTKDDKSKLTSNLNSISDGGAALNAYSKLQFTEMAQKERIEIRNSLLKYCELDTLAMVMIYEHFTSISQ